MLPWLKKPPKKTGRSRSRSHDLPWSNVNPKSSGRPTSSPILQDKHSSVQQSSPNAQNKRAEGGRWESMAKQYLLSQELRFVEANVFTRLGELDLIMLDGKTIVMIEVRSRSRSRHGSAAASVNIHKRRRVVLAARCWLHQHRSRFPDPRVRFDVIAIDRDAAGRFDMNWYRAAFDADGWV